MNNSSENRKVEKRSFPPARPVPEPYGICPPRSSINSLSMFERAPSTFIFPVSSFNKRAREIIVGIKFESPKKIKVVSFREKYQGKIKIAVCNLKKRRENS